MYHVSTEILNQLIEALSKPVDQQEAIFNEIEFNPYDNSVDDERFEYGPVVFQENVTSHINEVIENPEYYDYLSEPRIEAVSQGDPLTDDELTQIKESFITQEADDEGTEFAIISEISNGESSIFTCYFEQMQGQGGLHSNSDSLPSSTNRHYYITIGQGN